MSGQKQQSSRSQPKILARVIEDLYDMHYAARDAFPAVKERILSQWRSRSEGRCSGAPEAFVSDEDTDSESL